MFSRKIYISLTASTCLAIASLCFAGTGPETINLKTRHDVQGNKKAVIFPHWKHQEKLACTKCHPTDKGGPLKFEIKKLKGIGNDFHKKMC